MNKDGEDEVMIYLKQISKGNLVDITLEDRNRIYEEIIYGGQPPHDVIEGYYNKISAKLLNY